MDQFKHLEPASGYNGDALEPSELGGQIARSSFYEKCGKRLMDLTLIIISFPFLAPVLLLIAVLVKLDGGPIFYSQVRLGRSGQPFCFWKFRTMVVDAEERLDALLREDHAAAHEWAVSQKLRDDPRITQFGTFLRKSSLDELPQLWNVLVGDMSLVGPRPMMPDQRELYPGAHYELMRPGITGLWQVSERNDSTFADRARYDERYYDMLSFRADAGILASTVGAVLKGTGY